MRHFILKVLVLFAVGRALRNVITGKADKPFTLQITKGVDFVPFHEPDGWVQWTCSDKLLCLVTFRRKHGKGCPLRHIWSLNGISQTIEWKGYFEPEPCAPVKVTCAPVKVTLVNDVSSYAERCKHGYVGGCAICEPVTWGVGDIHLPGIVTVYREDAEE